MNKYYLFKMLESIAAQHYTTEENFNDILSLYELSRDDYDNLASEYEGQEVEFIKDDYLDSVSELIQTDERSYFTICSKHDFQNLTSDQNIHLSNTSLVYMPLNNHSRDYLHKGDVLFCYRQGQFGSLKDALETRGIYAVGFAASEPMILKPRVRDEQEYTRYGIYVYFPILLNQHLQLRNIQMHPNTVDLTPYNGNRNDALQHIPESHHYNTLLSLIGECNPELKSSFEQILDVEFTNEVLPDNRWIHSNEDVITSQISFNIDSFVSSLQSAGYIYDKKLVTRFISSLCAKPFTILTGLSGSGKTQLAVNFARWICSSEISQFKVLQKSFDHSETLSNYTVVSLTPQLLEIINDNGDTGKIIPLPTALIYEWFNAASSGEINIVDDPKSINRHTIGELSTYQKHIQGFYTELNKIAFAMLSLIDNYDETLYVKQYEIVPVGADWTNREPLLGFPNALQPDKYEHPDNGVLKLLINASNHPEKPFFLILDEMNLSHVERYFSDFLSVMETNEFISLYSSLETRDNTPSEIRLPKNLFIIGTVNIDETTYMFSPKVLDRANTIEFVVSDNDIESFLENGTKVNPEALLGEGSNMSTDFLAIATTCDFSSTELIDYNALLINFFKELKKAGAEFGYRTAHEIQKLIIKLSELDTTLEANEIMDIIIMQKLLPKLHGSRKKLCPILVSISRLCLVDTPDNIEREVLLQQDYDFNNDGVKYPITIEKLSKMYKSAIDHGYASYAEA